MRYEDLRPLRPLPRVLLGADWAGFQYFDVGGIEGYARLVGPARLGLEVLAVAAREPGRGAFREWLAQQRAEHDVIVVWEVHNPHLEAALRRRGFTDHHDEARNWGLRWEG